MFFFTFLNFIGFNSKFPSSNECFYFTMSFGTLITLSHFSANHISPACLKLAGAHNCYQI